MGILCKIIGHKIESVQLAYKINVGISAESHVTAVLQSDQRHALFCKRCEQVTWFPGVQIHCEDTWVDNLVHIDIKRGVAK